MQNSRGREILQDTWKELLEILQERNYVSHLEVQPEQHIDS